LIFNTFTTPRKKIYVTLILKMSTEEQKFDFDIAVIGGGSGGLAAAKEATKVKLDAKVCCFDFVKPSPYTGIKWGLGGTCVNVGCIPKKLMHYAGLLGRNIHASKEFGWTTAEENHSWAPMQQLIGNQIGQLNFLYKAGLSGAKVQYFNSYAVLEDKHTIAHTNSKGVTNRIRARNIILAPGGRPQFPGSVGQELCLTSDDIFHIKQSPGKTLVLGGGYIAMECAGFLNHIKSSPEHTVSVMVRSRPMRKFDEQCGTQISELMERDGVRFVFPADNFILKKVNRLEAPAGSVLEVEGSRKDTMKLPSDGVTQKYLYPSGATEVLNLATGNISWNIPPGPIEATYTYGNGSNAKQCVEIFDTVLLATSRTPSTNIGLEKAGVQLAKNGKILVDASDQTTVPNIFAIGDASTATDADCELTPVAIQAGVFLARRLCGVSKQLMNYNLVPTTVFTTPEYGFVGLTQEQADAKYGESNIEVWWSRYSTIEDTPTHPTPIKQLSSMYTGKNLWMKRYAEERKFDWGDTSFDVREADGAAFYQVSVETEQGVKPGIVHGKYKSPNGDWLYDVELITDAAAAAEESGAEVEIDLMMDDSAAAVGPENPVLKGVPASKIEDRAQGLIYRQERFLKGRNLAKLVCEKASGRVLGFHFVGDNAGEVTQGFALAMQMPITKQHFDDLVGIHPTAAEEFTVLEVTRSSGDNFFKKEGCGGGSCG